MKFTTIVQRVGHLKYTKKRRVIVEAETEQEAREKVAEMITVLPGESMEFVIHAMETSTFEKTLRHYECEEDGYYRITDSERDKTGCRIFSDGTMKVW